MRHVARVALTRMKQWTAANSRTNVASSKSALRQYMAPEISGGTCTMMLEDSTSLTLIERFRASMRATAASVSLVTSTDAVGGFHGMAATSWVSISMDPPSMLVTINRSASVHAVISSSGRYCLNLMRDSHSDILERFSRSDMRHVRFDAENWHLSTSGLPVLCDALASQLCTVMDSFDYGTHTVFVGRIDDVILPEISGRMSPLIWTNGSRASLANPATV
jgi:flavin reductase (DIM6/NTAB) family NADH-FMN oxidoreductase RutF